MGRALPASDMVRYSIQLNMYKILLEKCYTLSGTTIRIDRMFIVQLHPNLDGGLRVTQVNPMPEEMALIESYIQNRVQC